LNLIEEESKLVEGYKNRVNSFIYHMISDPGKYHFEDEHNNFSFRPKSPKNKKKIKLKPFVTDKVRVEKFLERKKRETDIINKNERKNKDKNNDLFPETEREEIIEKNIDKDKESMENYLQPIMKFKPRTDLERIFDTINLNYFGRINKNLINEKLKSLGLLKVYNKKNPTNLNEYSLLREKLKVNPETLEYLIKEKQRLEQGPKSKEIHELINNMDNIIQINKEIKSQQLNEGIMLDNNKTKKTNKYKNKRKNLNNFLAKNILGEYQKKTHFKALCTYSLDQKDNINKNKKMERFHSLDNMDFYENNDNNNYLTLKKRFKSNKNYIPMKMTYLRNLFMKEEKKPSIMLQEKEKNNNKEDNDENKIIRQQNNVIINGKYYKKNDLKGISDAILKNCNYISKHFEAENAGDGKMMFTRGLTVNEFAKRYGLPK